MHDRLDATTADALQHAHLSAAHEQALRRPGTFVLTPFVVNLDRAAQHHAPGSIAEVYQWFDSVETVQQLRWMSARREELDEGVVTPPTQLVPSIEHAERASPAVEQLLQRDVQRLVDRSPLRDCGGHDAELAHLDTVSAKSRHDGSGHQWVHEALMAGDRNDGVNLQAASAGRRQDAVMELRGARVVVTGGTSGIGTALVDALDGAGAAVVTCGRDAERCEALRRRRPGVHVVQIDLSLPGSGRSLIEEAVETLGGLDVVINNAGIQVHDQFVPSALHGVELRVARELAVNVSAPIEITAAAMPSLVASEKAAIVFVTSGLAVFPKRTAPVYCASKSALRTFAAALRYQTEDTAPHVTVIDAVLPLVDTPMTMGRGAANEKMSAEAVAASIIDAITTSRTNAYIGKARLLPWLVRFAPCLGRRTLRNG